MAFTLSLKTLTPGAFLLRWLLALFLVLITYNPLGYSFYHWAINTHADNLPLKVLAGIVLLICYVIFGHATWTSIRLVGVILVVALLAAILWVFYSLGWFKPNDPSDFAWIVLIMLATVMAVGLTWSSFYRRLTGQIVTDTPISDDDKVDINIHHS
ncbi:MAG: DUF6524 family protein [Gammaproteobacteria bacterium]